jgi:hypothetical protein
MCNFSLSMDSLHDYYKVDSSIVLGKRIQNEYPNTFVSRQGPLKQIDGIATKWPLGRMTLAFQK